MGLDLIEIKSILVDKAVEKDLITSVSSSPILSSRWDDITQVEGNLGLC